LEAGRACCTLRTSEPRTPAPHPTNRLHRRTPYIDWGQPDGSGNDSRKCSNPRDCDCAGALVCCAGVYCSAADSQRPESITTAVEVIDTVWPLESRKLRAARVCDSGGPVGANPQRKRWFCITGQRFICLWNAPSADMDARRKSGLHGNLTPKWRALQGQHVLKTAIPSVCLKFREAKFISFQSAMFRRVRCSNLGTTIMGDSGLKFRF